MFVTDAARLFEALDCPTVTGAQTAIFRQWVNRKVLPAIFSTGGYILNPDCISSAMVSDMDRMPIPSEAGAMLCAIAQDDTPFRYETKGHDAPEMHTGVPLPPQAYGGDFFRRLRALGEHPAVRDLNELVDTVVMPALFANPDALEHLSSLVEAHGGAAVLDI